MPNWSATVFTPKVRILVPLAATKEPVAALDEEVSGNTETSAPLSIKKSFPEIMSLIEIVPLIFPALPKE